MRTTPLDRIGKAVDRVLRVMGTSVQYIHVTAGGSDVLKAEAAFPSVHNGLIAGTVTQVGEVVAMVAAERLGNVEPNSRGRLVVDGRSHQVVKVDPIYAGERVASWIIQAGGS